MHRRSAWRRARVPALLLVLTALLLAGAHLLGPGRAAVAGAAQPVEIEPPVVGGRHRPPPGGDDRSALTLVGLGDSVPAGSACGCTPFVDLYGTTLAARTGREVRALDLGVPGLTSAGLLATLEPGGSAVQAVRTADVLTVTIGANDLDPSAVTSGACTGDPQACYAPQLAAMTTGLGAVLDRVRALRAGRPLTVQVTGYWDVWKDGAVARALGSRYTSAADRLTRLTNAALARGSAAHGASFVDLYAPFKGTQGDGDDTWLLAPDGDHPDAQGHALIAEQLAASPAAQALASGGRG